MKKINIVETFSGIGAQHKALSNVYQPNEFEVVGISDWDINSVLSYAGIHYPNFQKDIEDPSENDLRVFFENNQLSRNGKDPSNFKVELNKENILIYKAFQITKNIGSIINSTDKFVKLIKEEGQIDIFTYSFPCQDLSSGGNFHGGGRGIKEGTRSGLLLEIEKIISSLHKMDEKENKWKPKVLLLENVIGMLGPNNKDDFFKWINLLESFGYATIWGKIDSSKFGLLQKRRRVFAVSILKEMVDDDFASGENLEQELLRLYSKRKKQTNNDVFDFENKYNDESMLCAIKDTPSRRRMIEVGPKITSDFKGPYFTVTTKQDRNPNLGSIEFKNDKHDPAGYGYTNRRYVTPRETYKLMGFTNNDYNKAKKALESYYESKITVREKMWMQAGNSIAVNVLEEIFKYIKEVMNE